METLFTALTSFLIVAAIYFTFKVVLSKNNIKGLLVLFFSITFVQLFVLVVTFSILEVIIPLNVIISFILSFFLAILIALQINHYEEDCSL